MKEVTITIYEYDELEEKVKEKVREKTSEFIWDTMELEEWEEDEKEKLKDLGIVGVNLQYNFSYSQGDAVVIYKADINLDKYLTPGEEYNKFAPLIEHVEFSIQRGEISYEIVEPDCDSGDDISEYLDGLAKQYMDVLSREMHNLSIDLRNRGYLWIEGLHNDETIEQEAKRWMYYPNGCVHSEIE